jgi:calcineurin-like phosphoesterase family protein
MFKPYKLDPRKNKILFLSDLHENHDPSWSPAPFESRGFKSNAEFSDWFRTKWFQEVDSETIVIDLGDSHFSDPRGEAFLNYTRLSCKEHFYVWGNHQSGSKQIYQEAVKAQYNTEGVEIYPIQVNSLTFIGHYFWAYIEGFSVYCQHYAQYIWPELSKGGICLSGHSHGTCKVLSPDAGWMNHEGRVMDIGLDNAIKYRNSPFFRWEDVKKIMEKREIIKKDHH